MFFITVAVVFKMFGENVRDCPPYNLTSEFEYEVVVRLEGHLEFTFFIIDEVLCWAVIKLG